jgi:hypothetical protein
MSQGERVRSIVAQGWTMMFMVFLANITIDVVKSMINSNSTQWAEHIGMGGAQFILVIMAIYAVMPILIRTVSARWFRVAVVVLTILMMLFVLAHEFSHVGTDKPFGVFHTLDITHHLLAVLTVVAATMWARQQDAQR